MARRQSSQRIARAAGPDHRSLRAAARAAIRDDILAGRARPGTPLAIGALQVQTGIGSSAIREALCQLAADGLVVAEEQRGFRVAPVSVEDLASVTDARVAAEVFVLQSAIAHGTTETEARLLAAFHRLSKTPNTDADYAPTHAAFHEALIAACPNVWMKTFRRTLQLQSERYRALAVSYSETPRDILSEHAALVDAVLARDAGRAATLMEAHVRETARRVVALV